MARILVIDDEPKMRQMVCHVLAAAKHSVLQAGDGAEGLRILQQEHVSIVLTDILMPGTEGIETIFEIRRHAADVKIIAMSGGGDIGNVGCLKLAYHAGADAILPKPFRTSALIDAVDRLLSETNPAGDSKED